ncbi:MAG: Na+/H+ antiporter NhaC family protein [Myxococcota bacterium]
MRFGICLFAFFFATPAYADEPLAVDGVQLAGAANATIGVEGPWSLTVDGERLSGVGPGPVDLDLSAGSHDLVLEADGERHEATLQAIPGWTALIPPLLAIVLALVFRQVLLALVVGIWAGAFVASGYAPLESALRVVDHYVVRSVADPDHASILVFSLLLGGTIGIVTRSGGGLGLAALVTRLSKSSSLGQLSAWLLGIVIFFDDYANSLLVGSSMRPITDRLRVSREKLAFLVDATAAPVASVALVSSWIGVEVGYIGDQLAAEGVEVDAYWAFLQTLPYRFYPFLMLFFGLALVLMKRDFGPMYAAEMRARETGKVVRPGSSPASDFSDALPNVTPTPINALVPVLTIVLVAIVGMYLDGRSSVGGDDPSLREIFGEASSIKALLWASAFGGIAAVVCSLGTRTLSLTQALDAWLDGVKSMLLAAIILVLAWSLGGLCRELHTAEVVIAAIGPWLDPAWISAAVFIVAALVSFATGTSWGTMAILFPLVVPLANELAAGEMEIMYGAIGSILAGAVWGDHCSPISDTTIMSSMASSCDHVDHVRTQLPYALLVGVVSIVFGELATGYGLYPAWVGLVLGALVLFGVIRVLGHRVPDVRLDPRPAGGAVSGPDPQEES